MRSSLRWPARWWAIAVIACIAALGTNLSVGRSISPGHRLLLFAASVVILGGIGAVLRVRGAGMYVELVDATFILSLARTAVRVPARDADTFLMVDVRVGNVIMPWAYLLHDGRPLARFNRRQWDIPELTSLLARGGTVIRDETNGIVHARALRRRDRGYVAAWEAHFLLVVSVASLVFTFAFCAVAIALAAQH